MTLIFSAIAFAHEGHHHEPHDSVAKKTDAPNEQKRIFEQINLSYESKVKPIFQNKCMDCHSSKTNYPNYYHWPIARQLIDHDTEEAKEHIGIDKGFPFSGHGTPLEDLEAIKKVTEDDSMPPWRYRIMHSGSKLSEDEKKSILQWSDEGIKLLDIKK